MYGEPPNSTQTDEESIEVGAPSLEYSYITTEASQGVSNSSAVRRTKLRALKKMAGAQTTGPALPAKSRIGWTNSLSSCATPSAKGFGICIWLASHPVGGGALVRKIGCVLRPCTILP